MSAHAWTEKKSPARQFIDERDTEPLRNVLREVLEFMKLRDPSQISDNAVILLSPVSISEDQYGSSLFLHCAFVRGCQGAELVAVTITGLCRARLQLPRLSSHVITFIAIDR